MNELNFLEKYQKSTERNYVERVISHDKAECATVAGHWGRDYWDGERQYGYGGYTYDGRWLPIAEDIAAHYELKPGDRILDIGCGKAFLLYEFTCAVPGIEVTGIDVSSYGIANSKEEVRGNLREGAAQNLPWADNSFDFVYSINTFHNLGLPDLKQAVMEMERVSKGSSWLCVESYRNEREKMNLLYWQLTCQSFHNTNAWKWLLAEWGFSGDCGFIFFE